MSTGPTLIENKPTRLRWRVLAWLFARGGGAIAPLLMMLLVHPEGWCRGFILISLLGLVWAWSFFRNFRDTSGSPTSPRCFLFLLFVGFS